MNKSAKTIEDLEELVHQRTCEYEQAIEDLEVFEQSVLQLNELKT